MKFIKEYDSLDGEIPSHLHLRHSWGVAIVYIVIVLAIACRGVYYFLAKGNTVSFISQLIISVILGIILLRKHIDRRPLVTLSKDGIEFRAKSFRTWEEVDSININVIKLRENHTAVELVVSYKFNRTKASQNDKQDITRANYSVKKIKKALSHYKPDWEK